MYQLQAQASNVKQLDMMLPEIIAQHAGRMRRNILDMLTKAKSSHLGCSFSVVDILAVVYHAFLNVESIKQQRLDRDYFILSKGHSAAALYTALASAGIIPEEILSTHYQDGSVLCGHPMKGALPGIESSTGSLGHGLSLGVGLALAAKHNKHNNKICVLVGDGECQEGSIWEAVTMAARFKLNNLTVIVDYNNLQGLDITDDIMPGTFEEKFKAFACNPISVDGHNIEALLAAFAQTGRTDKPDIIVARTHKGRGVSFIEDKIEWHYKSFSPEQFSRAHKELCP